MKMDYHFKRIAEEVQSGELDSLQAFAILKSYENDLKAAMAIVKPLAIEDSELHGTNFTHRGYRFERRNGKIIYDFSDIQDIVNLKAQVKELEMQSKQALKHTIVDDTTGEQIQPPKVKFASDVLICKKL